MPIHPSASPRKFAFCVTINPFVSVNSVAHNLIRFVPRMVLPIQTRVRCAWKPAGQGKKFSRDTGAFAVCFFSFCYRYDTVDQVSFGTLLGLSHVLLVVLKLSQTNIALPFKKSIFLANWLKD